MVIEKLEDRKTNVVLALGKSKKEQKEKKGRRRRKRIELKENLQWTLQSPHPNNYISQHISCVLSASA